MEWKEKWLKALKDTAVSFSIMMQHNTVEAVDSLYICSVHFEHNCFTNTGCLKPNSVPSRFLMDSHLKQVPYFNLINYILGWHLKWCLILLIEGCWWWANPPANRLFAAKKQQAAAAFETKSKLWTGKIVFNNIQLSIAIIKHIYVLFRFYQNWFQ